MRVVVTGGAGFIGKQVLDWLTVRDHAVLVIDNFSTGRQAHVPPGVEVRKVDMTTVNAAEFAGWLREFRAEGVIHLAAMHFIPDCMARPERTFAVNTQSTHTVIEALELHPVQRAVLASTMDVYGNHDRTHVETDTPSPSNIYGLSKLLSEQILAYGVRRDLCQAGVALRLANVYGPYETNPHLIPDVIERIAKHETNDLVMGYLGASRDFVFVKEVADAMGRAVTSSPSGFHAVNVGTGRGVAVRAVVQTLQKIMGDDRMMREDEAAFRKFDRRSLTPDVTAITKLLGWKAALDLHEGLAETVRLTQAAAKHDVR